MQINKSDRNDAVGIARIMQCGWYKEVHVKALDSHAIKALLVSRALLVKIKRDLENQIRGLLKKSWPGHRSGQDEHVCPARC
jgi:transposase